MLALPFLFLPLFLFLSLSSLSSAYIYIHSLTSFRPKPKKLALLLSSSVCLSFLSMVTMASQEAAGQGIKLFGTTITLHGRQVKEVHNKADHPTLDKKPDKIIPCPRCKSMETKFCYFNNYNVNQPRHFCKGCQRYWTAGGALRNVPVGAGRRKAKPPGPGLGGFPEGCLYDGSSGEHQFELEGMVLDEWHVEAASGGFRQVFPMKRRRISCSGGQPY